MTATAALRVALGPDPPAVGPAGLVGLEHEYQLALNGRPADFRELIGDLAIPGRRLDPGDRHAYRCPSGLALTCDGNEAEIASPPVTLSPRFAGELDAWAHAGLALLGDVLPPGAGLTGYSTHLSAAVPDSEVEAAARTFVRHFAPAVMLALDSPQSHGVYVRPRPGRLELCGEYAIGSRLRAAALLFAGAVRACVGSGGAGGLPAALDITTVSAMQRPGLQVDRRQAFGFDLYLDARRRRLPLVAGGTISVQAHLEAAWNSARSALGGNADPADVNRFDRMVEGSLPLGVEADVEVEVDVTVTLSPPTPGATPFGDLLAPRRRPGFTVEPAVATWAYTVFQVSGRRERRYACVPRPYLRSFLAQLDRGRLDPVLLAALRTPASGARLQDFGQAEEPGLWDELVVTPALQPWERSVPPPQGWGARAGKSPEESVPPLPPAPPPPAADDGDEERRPALAEVAPAHDRRRRRTWRRLVWLLPVLAVGGAVVAGPGALRVRDGSPSTVTATSFAAGSTSTSATTATTATTTVATTGPTTIPPTTSSLAVTTTAAGGTTTGAGVSTSVGPNTTSPTTGPTTSTTVGATVIQIAPDCTFKPAPVSLARGTAVAFENTASVPVRVIGSAPSGGASADFTIPPAGRSPTYPLVPSGSYTFRCTGSGSASWIVVVP